MKKPGAGSIAAAVGVFEFSKFVYETGIRKKLQRREFVRLSSIIYLGCKACSSRGNDAIDAVREALPDITSRLSEIPNARKQNEYAAAYVAAQLIEDAVKNKEIDQVKFDSAAQRVVKVFGSGIEGVAMKALTASDPALVTLASMSGVNV